MAATAWDGGWAEIGLAVRRPEAFAQRWREALAGDPKARGVLWLLLGSTTGALALYGLTMGVGAGLGGMLTHALTVPAAAMLAWGLSLPALYVVNTAAGWNLDLKTTALAALTAVHFGAMARLASAPLSWFFGLALPFAGVLTAVHALVFGATALCMANVFLRVMRALEPGRGPGYLVVWLGLVALIDVELKLLLAVFAF